MGDLFFGEFVPDRPLLQIEQNLAEAINLAPTDAGYKPVPSLASQAAVLDEFCRGAMAIKYYDRTTMTFAGDRTKLYRVTNALATDVSSAAYALDDGIDRHWSFESFGEIVVAVNLKYDVQTIGKSDSNFAALGAAPKARHVAVVGLQEAFLMLGDVNDGTAYPNKVVWCEPGNLTAWTPGVGLAGEQLFEGNGGPIQALIGGEFAVVFQEQAVMLMEFTGQPLIFRPRQILGKHGLLGARAATVHNNDIYYVNRTGFHRLGQQGGRPETIGAGRVDNFFKNLVDPERLDDVQALTNEIDDLVIWNFPTRQALADTCDAQLIYSPVANQWGYSRLDLQYLFSAYSDTITADQITSSMDTGPYANVISDSDIFSDSQRILAGFDSANHLVYASGTPLPASFKTGLVKFHADKFEVINQFRPLSEGAGEVRGIMSVRDAPRDVARNLPVQPLSQYGFFEVRTARPYPRGRYFQFGLEIDNGWNNLVGVNIPDKDLYVDGERR